MIVIKNYQFDLIKNYKEDKTYKVKLEERGVGKKVSILSDSMFKTMFQNEKRIKYVAKLISYYIDLDYEEILNNIKFSKNELDKEVEISKTERSDLVVDLYDSKINIEVNMNKSVENLERNIEYINRLYANRVSKGSEYNYTEVMQININNFAYQNIDEIDTITLLRDDKGRVLTEKIIIINIYVPNLMKKWYNEGIKKLNEKEIYLISLIEQDVEKLNEFVKGSDFIMEYVEESMSVSQNNGFGESYDHELAAQEARYEDGYDDGYDKGIEKGKKDLLKELINAGFSKEEISRKLNISLDDIN